MRFSETSKGEGRLGTPSVPFDVSAGAKNLSGWVVWEWELPEPPPLHFTLNQYTTARLSANNAVNSHEVAIGISPRWRASI